MMSEREDRRLLKVSIAFIIGLIAIGIIVANIRYLDLGEGSQGAGPEIGQITMALLSPFRSSPSRPLPFS